jgi:redox-sensitive bicupin YhaK (pirin superfamily)
MESAATFEQELPPSFNGFLYMLDGDVTAQGATETRLMTAQVGWLEQAPGNEPSTLRLVAGPNGARAVLYAGERQGVPIYMHGPFVGESRADIMRISQDYMQGRMPRVSELTSA